MRYSILVLALFALAFSAFAAITVNLTAGQGYNFTSDSNGSAMDAEWQTTYLNVSFPFLGVFGQKTIMFVQNSSYENSQCPPYGSPDTTNYSNVTPSVGSKYCVYINSNLSYTVLNVTGITNGGTGNGSIGFDWKWANLGGGYQGNENAGNVTVHGWVSMQGSPVSNFTIHFQRAGAQGESATTDAEGYYLKSGMAPGNYTVDGFGSNTPGLPTRPIDNGTNGNYLANNTNYTYNITVQNYGDGGQGGNMNCGGNATITGYALMANGSPISGIMVNANTMMGGPGGMDGNGGPGEGGMQGGMNMFCSAMGLSGYDGAYSITTLTNGTYMIFAHDMNGTYADYQMNFDEGGIQLANNSSVAIYNITMRIGGRIIGMVYNNVSGNCTGDNLGNITECPGAANVFINAMKPTCMAQPGPDCFGGGTMTWQNGSFTLSITPGNFTVSLQANNLLQTGGATIGTYNISEGNVTDAGNVFLTAGRKLSGYALAANGSPILGTQISVMLRPPMGPGQGGFFGPPIYGDVNQGTGVYSIYGIKTGTWDVEVMPDFNSQYSRKVISNFVINDSASDATLNISLGSGASISGWVNCSGNPVQNGWIMAQDQSSNKFGPGNFDPTSFSGASIYNGQYSIRGIKPGVYEMHMDLPGSNCAPENAFDIQVTNESITRNFNLSSGYRLYGRVLSNGSGVANAFVNAFIPPTEQGKPPAGYGFAQTDAVGNYSIRGLKNGEYKVRVEPPRNSDFSAAMGDASINSSEKELNFTLGSGGAIRGRVVDSSGNAVQFAGVNAFSRTEFAFGGSGTNQLGEFTIAGLLPANDYYITVFPPQGSAYGKMSGSVGPKSVSAGTTNVGDITLSSANGTITGRVLNGSNNASGAIVHVWAMGQPSWGEATTGIEGTFNISGLSNGVHDVMVEISGYPPEFRSVTVNGSDTQYLNVTFSSPLTLSGYVTNGTAPIANVNVNIWNETLRSGASATTNAEGYYTMSVKNGSYNIGAFKPNYQFNKSTVLIAENAVQNLTLSLLTQVFSDQLFNVSGRVISTSGASTVYNRTVVLAERGEGVNNPFILDTLTDASGAFTLSNVPALNYTLVGIIPPNSTKTLNISVTNANVPGQNLTFD